MPVISKLSAARRQLDAAIRLFFASEDPVAVHSLAASAANLYSDLVENTTESESWRKRFGNNSDYEQRHVRAILNQAWNFFKHADRDAADELDFDEKHTELMILYATMECSELEPISESMQLFQLWLLRTSRFELELSGDIKTAAEALFPDLPTLDRQTQMIRGNERFKALERANRS